MANSGFVVAGKVVRAHGLRGELSVLSYVDSPRLFGALHRLYLKLPGRRPIKYRLTAARSRGDFLLLSLDGLSSRQEALKLLEADVWVRRRDIPWAKGELLMADLIGWEVELADGRKLGTILEVQAATGQELWAIQDSLGREILFPAVEEFILEVDEQAEKAVIDPPPGLLELYQNESS
jgi:16S rRNA processing protein RimM